MSEALKRLADHIQNRQFQDSMDGYRKVKEIHAALPKPVLTPEQLQALADSIAPVEPAPATETPSNIFVNLPTPAPKPVVKTRYIPERKTDTGSRRFIATNQEYANHWHAVLDGMFSERRIT